MLWKNGKLRTYSSVEAHPEILKISAIDILKKVQIFFKHFSCVEVNFFNFEAQSLGDEIFF